MTPRQRQARIAEIIWQEGQMSVDALAQRFAVSVETIRRDLGQLAEGGMLQKVHGGAKRPRLHAEASFNERMADNGEAKRTIAAKVTRLVEPGDTLFIDTGSTTLACAEALAGVGRLTVITNSSRIAQVFAAAPHANTVYQLGGAFHADNGQTVGPMVIDQIREFQADHAILTVSGLDPQVGATDSNFDEAQVARAMIANARHLFIVAHVGKLGLKAAFRVCRTEEIDALVTDRAPATADAEMLAAAGVEIR